SVAGSGQAMADHQFAAELDATQPINLTGRVTEVEWTNPRTWFFMDVKNEDGSVTNWGFEMPGPGQLLRTGMKRDSMKAGDVVTVDARRARDGGNRANAQTVVLTSTGQRLFGAQAR